ncbi:hypothetical protein SCHPADRAFT_692083 [Schizopora paradoxa]|uniref:Uncharacterized protein n=1 Tax=Schizopora paradoxa TaxID=27342 RepID=A0A0H2RNF4_9AGAM|nr:hypothetical protein SCHPADRAFT_692083 [Schizopora paradoxa]
MSPEDKTDRIASLETMSTNSPHEVGPVIKIGEAPLQQNRSEPNVRVCGLDSTIGTPKEVPLSNSSDGPPTLRTFAKVSRLLFKDPLKAASSRDTTSSELKVNVRGLAKRVSASRAAFDTVEDTIERGFCDICARDSFLLEWRKVRQTFEEDLRNSVDAVIRGHDAIQDFLSVIVPYILQMGTPIAEKIQVLTHFTEAMEKGQLRSGVVSKSFLDLYNIILTFRGKVTAYNDGSLCAISRVTSDLEVEIDSMTRSIKEVTRNLSQLKPIWNTTKMLVALVDDSMQRAETTRGLKEKELHILRRDSKEVNKLDAELKEHISALQNDALDFATFFDMIGDDIRRIFEQLTNVIEAEGELPEIFYQRLSPLLQRCASLMDVLNSYISISMITE